MQARQAHWESTPHQLSVSLLWCVSKEYFWMLQAAFLLCEWSAGTTAFCLNVFTSHENAKGEE